VVSDFALDPRLRGNEMSLEEKILKDSHTVALVGASPDVERPSYRVFSYLRDQGYRVIPVNPRFPQILGETCYADLAAIPEKVDVVDIFRRAEDVPPVVDQAIAIGAKVVWMQQGVINEAAASRAREAGLQVVMDKCMRKEHLKMRGIPE
jgi:predicted CoA-binding protein